MQTVGSKLKEIRKSVKLNQMQLAEKAGISRTYLSDVENDRYQPSISFLKKVSSALAGAGGIIKIGNTSYQNNRKSTYNAIYESLMEAAGIIDEKNSLEIAISNYSQVLNEINMLIKRKKEYEIQIQTLKDVIEKMNKEEEGLIDENNKIKVQIELSNHQERITKDHVTLLEKQIELFTQQERIKNHQIQNNQILDNYIDMLNKLKESKGDLLKSLSINRTILEEQIDISFSNAIKNLNNNL